MTLVDSDPTIRFCGRVKPADFVAAAPDPAAAAACASATAMRLCTRGSAIDGEIVALRIADLALAIRLQWARPVPCLPSPFCIRRCGAGQGPGGRGRAIPIWADAVAGAYALAAPSANFPAS